MKIYQRTFFILFLLLSVQSIASVEKVVNKEDLICSRLAIKLSQNTMVLNSKNSYSEFINENVKEYGLNPINTPENPLILNKEYDKAFKSFYILEKKTEKGESKSKEFAMSSLPLLQIGGAKSWLNKCKKYSSHYLKACSSLRGTKQKECAKEANKKYRSYISHFYNQTSAPAIVSRVKIIESKMLEEIRQNNHSEAFKYFVARMSVPLMIPTFSVKYVYEVLKTNPKDSAFVRSFDQIINKEFISLFEDPASLVEMSIKHKSNAYLEALLSKELFEVTGIQKKFLIAMAKKSNKRAISILKKYL